MLPPQIPTDWLFPREEFYLLVRPNWDAASLASFGFTLQPQYIFSSDTKVTFSPPGASRLESQPNTKRPAQTTTKEPNHTRARRPPRGLPGAAEAARMPPHGGQRPRAHRMAGTRPPSPRGGRELASEPGARTRTRGCRAQETVGNGQAEPREGSGARGRVKSAARSWEPRCQQGGRRRLAASRSSWSAGPYPASRAEGICLQNRGERGAPLSSAHLLAPRQPPS